MSELVNELVVSYVRGTGLILVALPMNGEHALALRYIGADFWKWNEDDIENQSAVRIAKQVDPLGQRTIGERPTLHVSIAFLSLL